MIETFSEKYDNGAAQAFECEVCARAYDEYRTVMDEVRELPAPDVPIDFHARVMQAVRREQAVTRKSRMRRLTGWASLAAACFALAVVVWLGMPDMFESEPELLALPTQRLRMGSNDAGYIVPERQIVPSMDAPAYGGWAEYAEEIDMDNRLADMEFNLAEAQRGAEYLEPMATMLTLPDDLLFTDAFSLLMGDHWGYEPLVVEENTLSAWVLAGLALLLIGGLGATLMAIMVYKKP